MAYSVTRVGGFGRPSAYREFVIDTPADVSTLPVREIAIGSTAFCIEDGMSYVFGNSNTWMECGSNSGGEDSGSGSGLPDVTTDDNGKVLTVVNGDWGVAGAGGYTVTHTLFPVVENASVTQEFDGTEVNFEAMNEEGVPSAAMEFDSFSFTHFTISLDGETYQDIAPSYSPNYAQNAAAYKWNLGEPGPDYTPPSLILVGKTNWSQESDYVGWKFYAGDTNTHTVSVYASETTVEVTPDFVAAVQQAMNEMG